MSLRRGSDLSRRPARLGSVRISELKDQTNNSPCENTLKLMLVGRRAESWHGSLGVTQFQNEQKYSLS